MTYRGKCPICSGQLKVVNIVFLECEKGDYACSIAAYEVLFEMYDNQMLEMTEKLLVDLKNINNIYNKNEQKSSPDEPEHHSDDLK